MNLIKPIRLGLVCDYEEEDWPSMDLTGEMILTHLAREFDGKVAATRICPPFCHRLSRWPAAGSWGLARNADRLFNRFWDYPRYLRAVARRGDFDLFHLVDHSYSQLVHELPAERTIVTCHDLDTFRCLLEPELEPRPRWFRALAGRTLAGLKRAAAVVCDSEATRRGLVEHGLVPESKLHVVFLGTQPECRPDSDLAADAEAEGLIGPSNPNGPPDLLHVGSNIPRKRIDVLLATFAGVRRVLPGARLIKVGGALTVGQERQARDLGVADAILILPFFSPRSARDRATLAAVYRRAALVLQPSEAEGFGLPVAEALACGAALLVSDIPVLREVGGDSPCYCPVGDVPGWTAAAIALLDERRRCTESWRARREAGFAQARRYSWSEHVRQLADIYREVLKRCEPAR